MVTLPRLVLCFGLKFRRILLWRSIWVLGLGFFGANTYSPTGCQVCEPCFGSRGLGEQAFAFLHRLHPVLGIFSFFVLFSTGGTLSYKLLHVWKRLGEPPQREKGGTIGKRENSRGGQRDFNSLVRSRKLSCCSFRSGGSTKFRIHTHRSFPMMGARSRTTLSQMPHTHTHGVRILIRDRGRKGGYRGFFLCQLLLSGPTRLRYPRSFFGCFGNNR